jgi:hypothetical protein
VIGWNTWREGGGKRERVLAGGRGNKGIVLEGVWMCVREKGVEKERRNYGGREKGVERGGRGRK